MYTPRDLRSSDPRGSPRSALLRNRAVISGTTVLTQLPGQGVTTGLKRTKWRERKKREEETEKREPLSESLPRFHGLMTFLRPLVAGQKDVLWSLAARLFSAKCRAVSSASSAILSAAPCCNLHKFWPSTRHAAAVTSRMTLKAGPRATLQCSNVALNDRRCNELHRQWDLLAILHSHKIAHNVQPCLHSRSHKKEKKKRPIYHLSESFVVSCVLYRFSAFEIYSRRSFAPGSVAQRGLRREPDEGRRFTVLVSLQGRRSWYLRLMEAGRNSRPRRDGFSPPPSPFLLLSPRGNILFSYDDISSAPGLTACMHAGTHAHAAPAAEPIIKRLRGRISARTARHDVAAWCRACRDKGRDKRTRNSVALVRAPLTMACAHRKPRSPPRRGES